LNFSSKARTIEKLSPLLKHSKVLPAFIFNIDSFKSNRLELLKKIQEFFSEDLLIVRSSAFDEDSDESSMAGHFDSVLNVDRLDNIKLSDAIDKVISSFDSNKKNEIFIQPMLQKMYICGVAFTSDIDTLAPYYVINYDDSGSPDSVTSGKRGNLKTYIHLKENKDDVPPPVIQKLIRAFNELEKIFENNFLDIEFGVNNNKEIFIFQVRPIVTKNKSNNYKLNLNEALFKVEKKIEKLSSPHPNLYGESAIFGVMPDWNPAEIIGIKPRRLSLSLYKEFITDNIWAYQRDNYGYLNLRSHPLLVSFLGVPYIDVRVDFNSFIPKNLAHKTARKLVEFYLKKLSDSPNLHDKVEFKIVHSCYYFNLEEKLKELNQNGFNKNEIYEIKESLLQLTNKIIDPNFGHYKKDLSKINELVVKKEEIRLSNLSQIDKIYWLTEYCKRYGTLPFAGIARAAFISTQILNSLQEMEVISSNDYNSFLGSLNTITSEMEGDLSDLFSNKISKAEFLKKYGHLRPGTYDILSLRYDENFENYFSKTNKNKKRKVFFSLTKEHKTKIEALISKSGLEISYSELIKFIKESIEAREYAKFIFTSTLSDIINLIHELGSSVNKSRDEMSHIDFKTILNLYNDLDHQFLDEIFDADISKFKSLYNYTNSVKLPSLILNPKDIYSHSLIFEEPNFISTNKIQASKVLEIDFQNTELVNKIVMIQSADPGYDYLFSKKIGGLITQYGGANSHMAVRCAELGIPAVIGAGESNFKVWSKANILEIDAIGKFVKIIS
jgi:glutamine kinase